MNKYKIKFACTSSRSLPAWQIKFACTSTQKTKKRQKKIKTKNQLTWKCLLPASLHLRLSPSLLPPHRPEPELFSRSWRDDNDAPFVETTIRCTQCWKLLSDERVLGSQDSQVLNSQPVPGYWGVEAKTVKGNRPVDEVDCPGLSWKSWTKG